MTAKLEDLVAHFGGESARTHCFLHVVNLIAKSLIKEFDLPKKKADEVLSRAEEDMQEFTTDIEWEDQITVAENRDGDPNSDKFDNTEGWVDEMSELMDVKRKELQTNIQPIRLLLVKLRKLAYKMIHSMTLILPEWKLTLAELKLPERIMPRDVSTRWNSTFDMLLFAIEYRAAIDTMMDK
ncbi:hypothetical protein EV702DRAFT_970247 [Suillus placidus]|uniref:Transposase n=1 Tax=Suillus placidus TaxID=48579 RepID=A0A9P6ZV92_9AGAM|nr:hypothetical protein EV702DRAFT_970247 [Suillus placidus]